MINRKNTIIKLVFALILCFSMSAMKAQNVFYLNLDSTIAIAKRQSYSIQMLKEDLLQASYQLKSIKRGFLPKLEFNGYLPKYTETIVQDEDENGIFYYNKKQSYLQGNFQLSQQLPTDGNIYVSSEASNLRDLFYKDKIINVNTSISIDQPLQAFYTYNATKAKLQNAKLQFELASKQYKREELNLIYDVSEAFYSVVSAGKQQDIALQDLKRQEDAYKTSKNKYEAGLIKEVEALQIEVDLGDAVNQYDVQTTTYIKQANQLKQQLGIPLKDSIIVENKIAYKPVIIDQSKAVEMGLKNRTEIREKTIQIKQAELQIKQQRAEHTIQGTISAYYDFIGTNEYSLNYPNKDAFNQTYHSMLTNPGNKGITLQLQIPILDWGSNRSLVKLKKSQLKQTQLQLDNQLVSIENEIRNKVNNLQSNLRRLLLLEKNVKLAEKSYNISYDRFTNGDINAESLGLDRSRFNNAQQSYLQAYINYKLGLLDLNRQTFYDFENNKSLVEGE
jgi:outer membrane protein